MSLFIVVGTEMRTGTETLWVVDAKNQEVAKTKVEKTGLYRVWRVLKTVLVDGVWKGE
jgi:hypothetical protein